MIHKRVFVTFRPKPWQVEMMLLPGHSLANIVI